jgi:hypothetical protein
MTSISRQAFFSLSVTMATLVLAQDPAAAQQELLKLLPADGAKGDCFGVSVACSGNFAIAGAYGDNENGSESGSAYVFDAVTGQQLRRLLPSDGAAGDWFGISVAIDGNRAVIGAQYDEDGGTLAGSAYVFDVTSGQQHFKLLSSDGAADDKFGWSVAVSGDRAIIGVPYDDDNGSDSGSAYVFDLTTGQQIRKLLPSDGSAGDQFGRSVSISGNTAAAGAPYDKVSAYYFGAAYVFDVSMGQQLFKVQPPWSPSNANPNFGGSVAVSGNLLIGGALNDHTLATGAGAAYIFDVTTGLQLFQLLCSDGAFSDFFGHSVAIDGDLAVVGAYLDDDLGTSSGSACVFDLTTGQQLLKFLPSDGAGGDLFGSAVSISGDLAVVGAFRNDDQGMDSGSAYVFSVVQPGTAYCFGDPGSGTPCPCNNDNEGSILGSGCANGVFASGAQLTGSGVASLTADTLILATTGLEPSNNGLYFQAQNDLSPGLAWGDGLRCAGADLIRLGVRFADSSGASDTSGYPYTISAKAGNISSGDTKYYQCWYRSPLNSPCGSDFNSSNGYAITWLP